MQPNMNRSPLDHLQCLCLNKLNLMKIETLKNNLKQDINNNKVNVDVLKNRVFKKNKKEKLQYRVVLGSVLVSIGVIGYFVT